MKKSGAIYVAILVPALAAAYACGGSTSAGSDGGNGGYGSSNGGGSGGGPCGAQSCATGCCDSNGVCQAGNTDTVCGTGNVACEDCTSVSKTCAAGQCGMGAASSSGGMMLPGFPGSDAGFPTFPTIDASLACSGSAGCAGQVCCFDYMTFGSSCQATCARGAYQLCASAADCPSGQTCTPSPFGATSPSYCAAMVVRGMDAGGRPVDSGTSGEAATPADAAIE